MEQVRRYVIEGVTLDIPLRYDERSGLYIEEYPDFIESPVWTSEGHPVMFAGEDACIHAEEAEPGGCPDCGSCRYYRMAGEHTWIGVCSHTAQRQNTSNQP